jgi:uracil DNA glycosylase
VPSHGNLERLQGQGVLFLNSALSVVKATPNSHQTLWKRFTETIIKSLDSKDVIFVLWGRDAIDKEASLKHSVAVRSSHPLLKM